MATMMKISQKSVATARPSSRSAVVVRASAESRRAVLTGFVAGAAALTLGSQAAQAADPIDLFDTRNVKSKIDAIYEARDDTTSFSLRDGLVQARGNLELVKSRVKAAEKSIDEDIEPLIKKNYWIDARDGLRLDVGTLRFDLNTLAESKPKEEKKKALALKKEFIAKVEALDYSLRSKDEAAAMKNLLATKAALDMVVAAAF